MLYDVTATSRCVCTSCFDGFLGLERLTNINIPTCLQVGLRPILQVLLNRDGYLHINVRN